MPGKKFSAAVFLFAVLSVGAVSAADDPLVRARARGIVNRWLTGGDRAGEVVVHDDFSDPARTAALWEFIGPAKVVDLGDQGKAVEFRSDPEAYTGFRLKPGKTVKIRPGGLYVVSWTVRAPNGGATVLMSVDGLDAKGKGIRPYQVRSYAAADQPGLFHRNVLFASEHLPEGSVALQVRTVFPRKRKTEYASSEATVGYLGEITITDVSKDVEAMLAALPPTKKFRDEAGEKDVLVNVSDNLCDTFPILPEAEFVPGRPGETLRVRECAGERARATAILWSKSAWRDVRLAFSDLRPVVPAGDGARAAAPIPAAALSAKIVKCHYQALGAPDQQQATGNDQVLVPELFVHDDDLVRVDHAKRHTLVKCAFRDGTRHVDVNAMPVKPWMYHYSEDELPIRDAAALQPFAIDARRCKQLVFALDVPKDAASGVYRGEVVFTVQGVRIAATPLELEVLPFALPRAETAYSPAQEFTMGLYVWGDLDPDSKAKPRISIRLKTREQLLNEYRLLRANGVDHPILIWHRESVILDEALLRRHLDVAREAGFAGELHLGSSDGIGNPTRPEQLEKLKDDVRRVQAVAREYGFDDVYFYGLDEVIGEQLLSQRKAWEAVHEAGGKINVSGYKDHFAQVGDLLDLIIYADYPESENPARWHRLGHKIWKYNSPQAGAEDPDVFRRAYGLYLWSLGYDGASTYCNCGSAHVWNDLSALQSNLARGVKGAYTYRSLAFVYLTMDGAVETFELTGLHAAIKDVRYMTKFRQLLRAKPNAEAEKWYKSLDFKNGDLVKIRRETVDWILRMLQAGQGRAG